MIKIASMVGAPDLETPVLGPYSGDLALACQKLGALGYDGVELMTKQPKRLDGTNLRIALEQNGLQLVALCTGHVFGEDGLGLLAPDLTIRVEALTRLKEFVDFAARYFGPLLINIGRARGIGDPARRQATFQAACGAFQELADYARPYDVRWVLEPISQKEVNFVHSTQDGLELVRLVNRPNFGLMLDTYHMQQEDADLLQSLQETLPYCWHIHFSDSNRCWPGSATIPFERIVTLLQRLGYAGYVGTEIRPWPDSDSAARLSIEYLRRLIPRPVGPGVSYAH